MSEASLYSRVGTSLYQATRLQVRHSPWLGLQCIVDILYDMKKDALGRVLHEPVPTDPAPRMEGCLKVGHVAFVGAAARDHVTATGHQP